ncbi:MAG: acyltransferase family protein, partial [Bacteroidia bacterium]
MNSKTQTTREPFYDNLKCFLIVLMVLGHFTFENRAFPIMKGLSNVIYSFHMPLFIFISGYFSKKVNA